MDTDKITKFYEEAINIISNASENSKNEFADYLIGYYTNLSANKLIECDITKDEAMEIANKIKAYKEEQKFDTEKEDMRVTRTVESIIYSTEKMNLDDALKHIQKEIDKYNNYELKDGKRFNKNDAGSVKEIVRKLELYKQGLIDDYEKFKTLDEAVDGHIKYAETFGLDERIGHIDKAIDYYNNTSSDKFTKEDTAYITKRLNAYKNTLEEKLNNKDDKNKENKESKIKVVGKRVCKWISKHKRQILIGVGCAAIATGLFAISASAIPTLMAANSANWWIAKSVGNVALMNTLHANNIALGAKIGAIFSAKTGAWTISAGSIIGKSALVSSVAGISGFSVSSIVSALHKKFVPKTNSNGEEVISKEEAKIYYDRGYKKDLKSNDKNKTSFQTLRNTFSKLFNRTKKKDVNRPKKKDVNRPKKKNDDEEWEPIVSTSNNNDRPSLSESEYWRKHFANNGVEGPGAKRTPIIDGGVISTDELEQSATKNDVVETVATSVASFMSDESTKEEEAVTQTGPVPKEIPTTQESVTKKVSLEKSKAKDSFGELADDMSELYFEKLGEKPVLPTNSVVYDAEYDKNVFTDEFITQENLYAIAYVEGSAYARSKKTPEDKKKVQISKEILNEILNLDISKQQDWSLGFNRAIEDFNKKTNMMTSEYLDLEQLNKLNPGANITLDELHPNILYSDIDANLLILPNGWYDNDKNGITNKHNTATGVYQTYTIEKYQEGKDKPSSHKR